MKENTTKTRLQGGGQNKKATETQMSQNQETSKEAYATSELLKKHRLLDITDQSSII